MEKRIEKDVKTLIAETFKIKVDKTDNLYLLGLMPKSERLVLIKMGNKKYLNRIERLYDLLNPSDMDKAFEAMIAKLSSYNVNQIF